MHGRRLTLTLFALLAALSLPSAASAADGDPDLTFSGDGQAYVDLPDEIARGNTTKIAQAPDGSLVVGVATEVLNSRGVGSEGIRIYRVSTDGEEIQELELVPVTDPQLLALRVLADGRIGFVYADGGNGDAVLDRLTAAGDNDPTVTASSLARECQGAAIAAEVRADGGAYVLDPCNVWAYDPNGAPDGDWSGGDAPFEPESYGGQLGTTSSSDLFIAPDGKVVVLVDHGVEQSQEVRGFSGFTSALVRYETDGDHDPTFGGDGVALTGNHAYDLTVGPDGRPVVVSDLPTFERGPKGGFEWALQRFTTGGEPDEATFGEGSYVGVQGELCCVRNTRITVQSDHKVLMVANHADWDRGGPYNRMLLRRYLENGEVDTTFGVGGDQLFLSETSAQGPHEWGPPVLQSDGKIVVPVAWENNGRVITLNGPFGEAVAITRFNNPSLAPPVEDEEEEQQQQQQQTSTTSTPSTGAVPASSPPPLVIASRRCTSRRSLRIRLRTGRSKKEQSRIVSAVVTVNGRRVTARRNGATVNLRNLPKGRYTVVINLRLADGGRVRDVRRYRTCAQKIERELAPLRTRKPRRT